MASPTLAQLRTQVRRDIRDPSTVTFEDATVTDFINAAIAEISRICPKQAVQAIPYVADTFEYACTLSEVHRVEIWNTLATPDEFFFIVPPAADNDLNSSVAGWELWAGILRLPNFWLAGLVPSTHTFRAWGWAGYAQLANDAQVADFDDSELTWAVREYATLRAFEYLMSDRSLFEQWATQANNTDVSPAALANMLGLWQSKWEKRRQQLRTIRTLP
jgi:hypothetical protein